MDPPFYERLAQRGFVIYPRKMSSADCFRTLIAVIGEVLVELGVRA